MLAGWYEKGGPAEQVIEVGDMEDTTRRAGRGARPAARLRHQPLRLQETRRQRGARISAHRSPFRRLGRRRGAGRGRERFQSRRPRLDLQRTIQARHGHGGAIYRAARGARAAIARQCQLCRRRLFRHSGHDRFSRGLRRRAGQEQNRLCAGARAGSAVTRCNSPNGAARELSLR